MCEVVVKGTRACIELQFYCLRLLSHEESSVNILAHRISTYIRRLCRCDYVFSWLSVYMILGEPNERLTSTLDGVNFEDVQVILMPSLGVVKWSALLFPFFDLQFTRFFVLDLGVDDGAPPS